jgi:DNA-binding NtrC family response regulator
MSDTPFHVCVVEDNDWYQKLLKHTIELNPDNSVSVFDNGTSLLENLEQENPDLITVDYRLPDIMGSELITKVREMVPEAYIVVISEQNDIETAVSLLKQGAFDYFTKTKDIRDRLHNLINHLRSNRNLRQKVDTLQEEVERKYDFEKSLIGKSQPIRKVFKLMQKAATNNISVMIFGETGTGKEVVAKAIHYNSIFKEGPFVPINMGAIPTELIESELFGYEKGAFTGANQSKSGKFEMANGGTLFLDEIAELDVHLQAKLLRVLQEREVTRLGSHKAIPFKCRIITATHQNLQERMKRGDFREDLYYRLYGLQIDLPPLRDREHDVLILADHFIRLFCEENQQPLKTLSKSAKTKLLGYTFPGNVRELKSIIDLAVVMADGDVIEADDISFTGRDPVADVITEELTLKEYQEKIIRTFLKEYDNDVLKVADRLDIGKSTIYRLLQSDKSPERD